MNGLHVISDDMRNHGHKTISESENLNMKINSLKQNMEQLKAIWSGLAADNFSEAVNEQISNLNSFKDLLNELGERIVAGADTFEANESENASIAGNLF